MMIPVRDEPPVARRRLDRRSVLRLTGLLFVLLLGWAARLYNIGDQSFWYDEGTTVALAPRDPGLIVASAAADIHPPLYYLIMHFAQPLFGDSEAGARFPSAIFGLLAIAAVIRLGSDVSGWRTGLVAGIALSTAPLAIWYSQEARMYSAAMAFGALATLALVRAASRRQVSRWLIYGVLLGCTLYSHYVAASVLVAHALALLVWTAFRPRRRLRVAMRWSLASGLAVLLFLPWLIRVRGQLTGWPATAEPYGVAELIGRTLASIANGHAAQRFDGTASFVVGVAILAGVCTLVWHALIWRARPAASELASLLALCSLVLPLAAIAAISLQRPFFHPKFISIFSASAELTIGVGIAAVGALFARLLGWSGRSPASSLVTVILLAGLLSARAPAVQAQWFDPRVARDDYRGLAESLERQVNSSDAVILDAPGQLEIVDHYYDGDVELIPLPRERPADPDRTAAILEDALVDSPRAWLVLWASEEADPGGVVENWLDRNLFRTSHRWFGGVQLIEYVNPSLETTPTKTFQVDARFGELAVLESIEVAPHGVRGGEVVPVLLHWNPVGDTDRNLIVFVHLLDAEEYLWGQHDSQPAGGARPTSNWRPGEEVEDRHGVPVYPGTPPGDYAIEVGLYDAVSGARLPATGSARAQGDRVVVGPISVLPGSDAADITLEKSFRLGFPGADLLGGSLHPLGRDEAEPVVSPGQTLLLTLFWRGNEQTGVEPGHIEVSFHRDGAPIRSTRSPIGRGRYPVARWLPGELVRDPHKVDTSGLPTGTYSMRLRVLDSGGRPLEASTGEGVVIVDEVTVR